MYMTYKLPLSKSQWNLHVVMGIILDASLRKRKLYLPMFEYLACMYTQQASIPTFNIKLFFSWLHCYNFSARSPEVVSTKPATTSKLNGYTEEVGHQEFRNLMLIL